MSEIQSSSEDYPYNKLRLYSVSRHRLLFSRIAKTIIRKNIDTFSEFPSQDSSQRGAAPAPGAAGARAPRPRRVSPAPARARFSPPLDHIYIYYTVCLYINYRR